MNDSDKREEELSIRLTMAQAWVKLWQVAFDALLYHRVNMRETKEYADTSLIDSAREAKDVREGQSKVLEYIKRLESGINAAVRRKSIKQV